MELSDTLKTFVDAQKHWPGVRFKEAKCHMDMEESWNEFGPPASKLRWCCSVRKSVPTLMLLSELTGKDTKAVVFDGVRAEESLRRSKYTEVGEGVKNIQQVNCHAILKWSSAEIFVYALKKNVLLNNAYRHGIYRVGCKVCPMSAKWQDSLISFNYSFSFCKQCLCAYKGQRTRTALKICRACSACWDAIPVPMNITFRDGCALLWSPKKAFCKKRVACIHRM